MLRTAANKRSSHVSAEQRSFAHCHPDRQGTGAPYAGAVAEAGFSASEKQGSVGSEDRSAEGENVFAGREKAFAGGKKVFAVEYGSGGPECVSDGME
jgi:hypothetical protein